MRLRFLRGQNKKTRRVEKMINSDIMIILSELWRPFHIIQDYHCYYLNEKHSFQSNDGRSAERGRQERRKSAGM